MYWEINEFVYVLHLDQLEYFNLTQFLFLLLLLSLAITCTHTCNSWIAVIWKKGQRKRFNLTWQKPVSKRKGKKEYSFTFFSLNFDPFS